MTTSSQSELSKPNEPTESAQKGAAEVSGVVVSPSGRETMDSLAKYFEPPPRTSLSPVQLSQRRRQLRPVVMTILAVALVLLAAAAIRLAFMSHGSKAQPVSVAPAPAVEMPAAAPAEQATDNNQASGAPAEPVQAADAHHRKASLSRRPKKFVPALHTP
jgi:hypothetical protein